MPIPKKTSFLAFLLLITFSFVSLYILGLSKWRPVAALRLKSMDTFYKWRALYAPRLKEADSIVIIGLDDASYKNVNRITSWGRHVHALFLDNMATLDPAVTGLDFIFPARGTKPAADRWMAQALKKNKRMIMAGYFDEDGNYTAPYYVFRKSCFSYGFIDKPLDIDGVNRRSQQVVLLSDDKNVFSFSASIAYAYRDLVPDDHLRLKDGKLFFRMPQSKGPPLKASVSVDKKDRMLISYRYGPGDFQYFSYWDVLENKVPADALRGKIVMVGPISAVLHDIHVTPLGRMPGIYVNANEVLTFLEGDFIHQALFGTQWIWLLILAVFLTVFFYRSHFWVNLLTLIVIECVFYATSAWLFIRYNLLIDIFSFMFVSLSVYFTVMLYKGLRAFIQNAALQRQVVIDSLTGLYVHRYLIVRLEAEFTRHAEARSEFCFVMIDIDFFKKVNDTYGHEQGNAVLLSIAKILKTGIRGYDVAARYGGEEFSLILGTDERTAMLTLERIRTTIEASRYPLPNGGSFHVTISAGICSNRDLAVKSSEDLIRFADMALYEAKQGRNRTRVYRSN